MKKTQSLIFNLIGPVLAQEEYESPLHLPAPESLPDFPKIPKAPAEIINPALSERLHQLTGIGFLSSLIKLLITLFLIVGGVLFFFLLLLGGIQLMTSGGDKAGVEAARGRITTALTGLVILLSSFAIIRLIEIIFGINLLTINLEPLILK